MFNKALSDRCVGVQTEVILLRKPTPALVQVGGFVCDRLPVEEVATMAKKKKEGTVLLCRAECRTLSGGKPRSVFVYQKGRSYLMQGPDFYRTACHPAVHTEADIKKEIALVYKVEVVRIKYRPGLGPA